MVFILVVAAITHHAGRDSPVEPAGLSTTHRLGGCHPGALVHGEMIVVAHVLREWHRHRHQIINVVLHFVPSKASFGRLVMITTK